MGRKDKKTVAKSQPSPPQPPPSPPPPIISFSDASSEDTTPQTTKQNHHSSDASSDDSPPPPKPRSAKRPAENTTTTTTNNPDSQKRVKKMDDDKSVNNNLNASTQKPLFQRVWSNEDEIVILKGMIEYKAKKGIDPMSNVDDFIDFIKIKLHVVDVNKGQIFSKVRRFKKRFVNAQKKKITDSHELEIFELSKQIWRGPEITVEKTVEKMVENGDVKEERSVELWDKTGLEFGFSEVNGVFLKGLMEKMRGGERKEMREMIDKANEAYLEAYLLKLKVMEVAGKKVLDGIKNDLSKLDGL